MSRRWNVALLAGGFSAERLISIDSAVGVKNALLAAGHCVDFIDPEETDLSQIRWSDYDVAFIALHGCYGEDGQVQRELKQFGIPYTGSGPDASLLAFHKAATKLVLRAHGVSTPDFEVIQKPTSPEPATCPTLPPPFIIKPECDGSSYGISLVETLDDYPEAAARAFQLSEQILVEAVCSGEEWTVPLLDNQVLPPICINSPRILFDTAAKYFEDTTTYEVANDLDAPHIKKLIDLARHTATAIGTRGLARIDIRYDHSGNPQVLEVNTIPGMTSHSLVPKSAAAHGWTFTELCERAIQSSLRNDQG